MFKSVKIHEGHDNFFTPLRLLFATLVVVGHTFSVALRDANAEPHVFFIYTFSYLAVNLFFVASGFLVTKSMLYRKDKAEFSSARFLRIYPGLFVHVLFVMFIIGPIGTSLPLLTFMSDPSFFLQPLWVLTFFETNMVMPGMFEANAEPIGSAPLWTLRYEILAYIGTLLAFSLGFMKKRWMLLAQFVLPTLAWIAAIQTGIFENIPATLQSLLRFGVAYGLGAAIFAYKDTISFNLVGLIAVTILAVITQSTVLAEVTVNIMLAYFIFFFAYIKAPKLNWMQGINDLSYGIYIYHWCVMQTVFMFFPGLGVASLFVFTMIVTTILAALSWHYVEKPALKSKKSFAKFLRFSKDKKSSEKTVLSES